MSHEEWCMGCYFMVLKIFARFLCALKRKRPEKRKKNMTRAKNVKKTFFCKKILGFFDA